MNLSGLVMFSAFGGLVIFFLLLCASIVFWFRTIHQDMNDREDAKRKAQYKKGKKDE